MEQDSTYPTPRREAIFLVTPEVLIEMCKASEHSKTVRVIEHALPDDAKFERAEFDPADVLLRFVVSSASFQLIAPYDALPILPAPLLRVEYASTALVDEALNAAKIANQMGHLLTANLLRRLADAIVNEQRERANV